MSIWSTARNASLGAIIDHLSTLDPAQVVADGFSGPHSYRGYYEDLAFRPAKNVTVGTMLVAARSAVGQVFSGYKGGDYTMDENTDCWLAEYGDTGIPIVIGSTLAVYVLPERPEASQTRQQETKDGR